MSVKNRLFALAISGPLLFGIAACAKKQVLQEGVGSTPQPQAGEVATSKSAASPAQKSGIASSPSEGKPAAAAVKPASPPPGTAALAEAPRMAPDKGLGGQSTPGLSRIHFGFDQATLTPEAREALTKNAKVLLNAKPDAAVRIEGYCDERGTAEYNIALGERRAATARQYLEDLGVEGSRLTVVSYGKEMPIDPAHTEEAWAANRRDEFAVLSGR